MNRYKLSFSQTGSLYFYKDPLFVQDPHNQIIESDKQKTVNQRGQISVGKNKQDGGINLPLQTNSTNCDNLEQSSQHTGHHIDEQRIRAKNMERIRPFLFLRISISQVRNTRNKEAKPQVTKTKVGLHTFYSTGNRN